MAPVVLELSHRFAQVVGRNANCNELVAPLHDRMPVILQVDSWPLWLDRSLEDPEPLLQLLRPFEPSLMETYPVDPIVNSPDNDVPACIERAQRVPTQGRLF